jgi:hypothetical protein
MPSENLAVSHFLFRFNVRIVYVLAVHFRLTCKTPQVRQKSKAHPLYETVYVIPYVGTLMEEMSRSPRAELSLSLYVC